MEHIDDLIQATACFCPFLTRTHAVQPKSRAKVIETLLKYVHTDSALCRYEPGPMANRQAQVRGVEGAWIALEDNGQGGTQTVHCAATSRGPWQVHMRA